MLSLTLVGFWPESGLNLEARGGGAKALEFFKYRMPYGKWSVVLHVLVDTRDAMGANLVNTICEGIAPRVEQIAKGKACLKILSNLADKSMVTANVIMPLSELAEEGYSAESVRDGIVMANEFANADPYRAATHNKGIMNGIDAVAIATGNDWRAVEAGAHAYAARTGSYTSLSRWQVDEDGSLSGELEIPLALGTIGGATGVHPGARDALALMGVERAQDLAEIVVSVGLAQNLAALRALATEGIQRGHMGLHARQLAIAAGAKGSQIDEVAGAMIEEDNILLERAEEHLKMLSDG